MKITMMGLVALIVSIHTYAHDGVIEGVRLVDCYDGDTCTFGLDGPARDMLGPQIVVRFRGIDAPELNSRAGCDAERELAQRARDFLRGVLSRARAIRLRGAEPGDFNRFDADVYAGRRNLGRLLIREGLAREWPDGAPKPEWCR